MISVDMDDTENAEALSEWLRTEAPAGRVLSMAEWGT